MKLKIRIKNGPLLESQREALIQEIRQQVESYDWSYRTLDVMLRIQKNKMTVKMLLRDRWKSFHTKTTASSLTQALDTCYSKIEKMQKHEHEKMQSMRRRMERHSPVYTEETEMMTFEKTLEKSTPPQLRLVEKESKKESGSSQKISRASKVTDRASAPKSQESVKKSLKKVA